MGFFDSIKQGYNNSTKDKPEPIIVQCPYCGCEKRVYGKSGEIKCFDCDKVYRYEIKY